MGENRIAKLLNPEGYCVPELKDFFKKREPVSSGENWKKKFYLQDESGVKKLRTSKENLCAGLENDILDSSLKMEDTESDIEEENIPAGRHTRRRKKKVPLDKEKESRTVFVGNLPNLWNKMKIKRFFSKYGPVETVRLRCAPLADPRVSKKVAVIKKNFHPDRTSIHGYVRFIDADSAAKAVQANGTVLGDHHIRVDMALNNPTLSHDRRKAIFIGNVPFSAEDDDLWTLFEKCGAIESIRVLRDRRTGVGKGFAYVNFKTPDAVELALKMNGEKLQERELRISRYTTFKKKKKKVHTNRRHQRFANYDSTKSSKGTPKNKPRNTDPPLEENKSERIKHSSGIKEVKFQGQVVSKAKKLKKKKKISKTEQRKKLLIEKLAGGLNKKK